MIFARTAWPSFKNSDLIHAGPSPATIRPLINKYMEYYYIDFNDLDIYSWEHSHTSEYSDLDRANKLIGNSFESYQAAKIALEKILEKQAIA